MMKRCVFVSMLLFCSLFTLSQPPPVIEHLVTLTAKNKTISEVLQLLSLQTGAVFSYSHLNMEEKNISLNCKNKPLRSVLNELFSESGCTYKIKSPYIIIICENHVPPPQKVITGYLYSKMDSTAIRAGSLYITASKKSAISNYYGLFHIAVSAKNPSTLVTIAKKGFYDTTISVQKISKKDLVIYLTPRSSHLKTATENSPIPTVLIQSDSLHQASPASPGTNDPNNLTSTGNTVQKKTTNNSDSLLLKSAFSQNSSGVTYTVADSAREKEKNSLPPHRDKYYKRKLTIFKAHQQNIHEKLINPFAFSIVPGIGSNALLSAKTINKKSINLLAGISSEVEIFEIGGLINWDKGNVKYFQLAGIANIVEGNSYGVQISSVFNKTRSIKGVQLSGILNTAAVNNGLQVSGLINRCKQNNGLQISFLNLADSSKGIPIGIISIVKSGTHQLELAGDEMYFTTAAFRTGVPHFHNILLAGINSRYPDFLTFGYGIGSTWKLKGAWLLTIETSTQQLQYARATDFYLNLLNKFHTGIEYRIGSKFGISAGPTFNYYLIHAASPDLPFTRGIAAIRPVSSTSNSATTSSTIITQTGNGQTSTTTTTTVTTQTDTYLKYNARYQVGFKLSFKLF